MGDRDTEYILVQNKKPKKKIRQYRYNEDDDDDNDDDDNNSDLYRRVARSKPHKEQRLRYMSSDEIESDNRREPSDPRIKVQKTTNGDRVILDEDDNIIKVIRNSRSTSPISINQPRSRYRPRNAQSVFYETPDNHIASRPLKKSSIHTKKTQIVYADDTPVKVLKKVIIDPRTGDRETIYEKDRPRKQQKFFLQQRPIESYIDSDDSDYQRPPAQYVRIAKNHQNAPRHDPSAKYILLKKRTDYDPGYATTTSKMPAIKSNRRVFYEVPSKKPLTTYIYPNGKYYK